MESVTIEKNTIGLIVRGKKYDSHTPGVMEQHADCILSNGEPIGFFGEGGDSSSDSSGGPSYSSSGTSADGPSISLNSVGINMLGTVADYEKMKKIRPFYVDMALAKKYNIISTILLVKTTLNQTIMFDQFWKNLKLNPGAFHLLGANCSSHASEAFINAKIVAGGIPGLDTPNNLYKQIKIKMPTKTKIYSGYVGFNKLPGANGYEIQFSSNK